MLESTTAPAWSGWRAGVEHGDEAPEGLAEHDRPLDLERLAEGAHVVGPLGEVPAVGGAAVAAALAAVVQVDDLGDVPQAREGRLEGRVVEAGPAVEQQEGGELPHGRPVRDELRALHVEEEAGVARLHAHAASLAARRAR